MNIHVPDEIKKKYPNMEFRGKPRSMRGRTLIEAVNHNIQITYYYSFEEDFFWFAGSEIPDWFIRK